MYAYPGGRYKELIYLYLNNTSARHPVLAPESLYILEVLHIHTYIIYQRSYSDIYVLSNRDLTVTYMYYLLEVLQ